VSPRIAAIRKQKEEISMAKAAAASAKGAPAKAATAPAKAAPAAAATKAAAAPAKKETTAQPTVTLKHLAATLAGMHEAAKKDSEKFLGDFVDLVVKHLKKGDRIRIGGLGIFQVKKRAARKGRNPATGEEIKIKASKKVAFRAAKELKEAV
jgi:DNA-binding protein HU-beta